MIRVILFDFDHTLYDRRAVYHNMIGVYREHFGDELPENLSDAELADALADADLDAIYPDGSWDEILDLSTARGIFRHRPETKPYYDFIRPHFPAAIRLQDDILPTLRTLRERGYRLGVLTNGFTDYQYAKLNATPIPAYMDIIRVSREFGDSKPSPRPFLGMCRLFDCPAEEMVYVGDSPVNDVCGARGAGLIPVWLRNRPVFAPYAAPAPYAIDRMGELPAVIEQIERDLAGKAAERE